MKSGEIAKGRKAYKNTARTYQSQAAHLRVRQTDKTGEGPCKARDGGGNMRDVLPAQLEGKAKVPVAIGLKTDGARLPQLGGRRTGGPPFGVSKGAKSGGRSNGILILKSPLAFARRDAKAPQGP